RRPLRSPPFPYTTLFRSSGRRLWMMSPRTAKLYFLESLTDSDLGAEPRVRNYANHLRFALHAGLGRQSWIDSPSKFSWLVTAPLDRKSTRLNSSHDQISY